MRLLAKVPCPQVLAANHRAWTDEYVASRHAKEQHRGFWGHDDIRTALHVETDGKCAYCESRVAHVAYEHVEHMRPKRYFPELSHDWENLTSACPVCNTKKGDYFSAEEPLLNPYVTDPQGHIAFYGGIPYATNDSALGHVTIRKLGLDRMQLVVERTRRLRDVVRLHEEWRLASGALKDAAREALIDDALEGEFSAAVRACLAALGFPVPQAAQ